MPIAILLPDRRFRYKKKTVIDSIVRSYTMVSIRQNDILLRWFCTVRARYLSVRFESARVAVLRFSIREKKRRPSDKSVRSEIPFCRVRQCYGQTKRIVRTRKTTVHGTSGSLKISTDRF